jgi:hypothetical protein
VLESVGPITRQRSSGDGRRRYAHLDQAALTAITATARVAAQPVVFVCTHNSARSQLAAELWQSITSAPAESAATQLARRVHPGAVRPLGGPGSTCPEPCPASWPRWS